MTSGRLFRHCIYPFYAHANSKKPWESELHEHNSNPLFASNAKLKIAIKMEKKYTEHLEMAVQRKKMKTDLNEKSITTPFAQTLGKT